MNKYEQLIEHIINDNEAAAKELFHQIVVEKSRDIYESLMDEEMGGNQAQSFVQDITQQDDAAQEHGLGEDDEEAGEIELGGDDEFGDEETFGDEPSMDGEDGSVEAKIDELTAQLEELKAMLGGQEEPSMDDMGSEEPSMDSDFDSEEGSEEQHGFGESEEPVVEAKGSGSGNPFAKSGSGSGSGSGVSGSGKSGSGVKESYKKTDVEIMKEYVDKIGEIYKQEPAGSEGKEVGNGGSTTVSAKSIVKAQGPKFDGETAGNIVNGGAEQAPDNKAIPEPKNEYAKKRGDLPGAGSFQNVPGGNAGKTGFKTKESAKSAEGSTTDGSVPVNKKSEIGGKVR